MGRFSDAWLIDKTMFEYAMGGACACCSFNFLPNGAAGLIQSMSEFETDQQNAEIQALDKLPWPPEMRDQVWVERVRLRQKLKKEMGGFKSFWDKHGEQYGAWLEKQASSSPDRIRKWFQLGRSQVLDYMHEQYDVHGAYQVVLGAVAEQVAHFELTKYPADGRGEAEMAFENTLNFNRMGGYGLKGLVEDGDSVSPDVIKLWMARHKALGGPKLLDRAPKVQSSGDGDDDDDEGGADDAPETLHPAASKSEAGPSFRSDRRIIRLMVARYWANHLQLMFLKEHEEQ